MNVVSEKFLSDSLGKETPIPVNDYIDIIIFGEKKSNSETADVLLQKRIKFQAKENQFIFRIKEQPNKVGVDPYHYLIDRVPDDNVKTIGMN